MAAGGSGVFVALAFYVFMYGQWCTFNDLAFQKYYFMNNNTYVDITNCNSINLDGFSLIEEASLIGHRNLEVEWTPKNVNKRNDITIIFGKNMVLVDYIGIFFTCTNTFGHIRPCHQQGLHWGVVYFLLSRFI